MPSIPKPSQTFGKSRARFVLARFFPRQLGPKIWFGWPMQQMRRVISSKQCLPGRIAAGWNARSMLNLAIAHAVVQKDNACIGQQGRRSRLCQPGIKIARFVFRKYAKWLAVPVQDRLPLDQIRLSCEVHLPAGVPVHPMMPVNFSSHHVITLSPGNDGPGFTPQINKLPMICGTEGRAMMCPIY